MSKWIAEFELEDGDTMPEHMDLEYKGAKIDFHCKPLPKGHGRIGDLDALRCENTDFDTYKDYCTMFDEIEAAETIIEADKEEV